MDNRKQGETMSYQEIIKELREILKVYHYKSDIEHMSKDVATSLKNLVRTITKERNHARPIN